MEARLAPEQREKIEQAAMLDDVSMSSFIVRAATERAERVLAEASVTVVSSEIFDRLLAAIDEPDAAPGLADAVARDSGRIE